MKKYSTLLGAAVVGLSATASFADITLTATQVNLTSLSTTLYGAGGTDPTLQNAGWTGYLLTLTATGTSTGINGYDFKNPGSQPQAPYNQPQTNIGIRGDIFQEWTSATGKSGTIWTPTPDNSGTYGGMDGYDSFFLFKAVTGPYPIAFPGLNNNIWSGNPATEDNNLLNGANPPYTQSPVADIPGAPTYDYGVGTIMTAAGALNISGGSPSSVNLAFIIVPTSVPTTIRGFVNDQNNQGWGIDVTLNPSVVVPEPASIGLLALGGLGLLSRRRRA